MHIQQQLEVGKNIQQSKRNPKWSN